MRIWVAKPLTIFLALAILKGFEERPANQIVQESARVTERDRIASASFDHAETDLQANGSRKTYSVHMLFGSPYWELLAINGRPISPVQQAAEKRKLAEEASRRKRETAEERSRRVEQFQKEEKRDSRLLTEFTNAFNFTLLGEQQLNRRRVYVMQASLRPEYKPLDNESKVLTGMRGKLWIDKQTYQWVRVEANVVKPVSIEGFVARVEPGTRFELEMTPVEKDTWLPKHYAMTAQAKLFGVVPHNSREEETYFDYRRAKQVEAEK
jgi:hypothetical protein